VVLGLEQPADRLEAYQRVQAYQINPRRTVAEYSFETVVLKNDIQSARDALPQVKLSETVAQLGLSIIQQLKIDSLRAEITLFEAARAYAAADTRQEVQPADLYEVAPLALRHRRSSFMAEFIHSQKTEENEILQAIGEVKNVVSSHDHSPPTT
jgi:magnesium chelatase subunit I